MAADAKNASVKKKFISPALLSKFWLVPNEVCSPWAKRTRCLVLVTEAARQGMGSFQGDLYIRLKEKTFNKEYSCQVCVFCKNKDL